MKKVVAVIAVLIIAGGGYALLKNNDNKSPDKTAQTTSSHMDNMDTTKSNSSSSTAPEATNSVEISNFAYSPASITVKKGTTVTWTNKDSTQHDVKETDGKAGPKSELLAQGKSYSFTFDTVGTFEYICSIHPSMTGTVTVTE